MRIWELLLAVAFVVIVALALMFLFLKGETKEMSVTDEVYKSAVKFRQDFRNALRKCRAENKASRKTITALDDSLSLAFDEIEALKESMDELYKEFKKWQATEDWMPSDRMLVLLEALKEKETR